MTNLWINITIIIIVLARKHIGKILCNECMLEMVKLLFFSWVFWYISFGFSFVHVRLHAFTYCMSDVSSFPPFSWKFTLDYDIFCALNKRLDLPFFRSVWAFFSGERKDAFYYRLWFFAIAAIHCEYFFLPIDRSLSSFTSGTLTKPCNALNVYTASDRKREKSRTIVRPTSYPREVLVDTSGIFGTPGEFSEPTSPQALENGSKFSTRSPFQPPDLL